MREEPTGRHAFLNTARGKAPQMAEEIQIRRTKPSISSQFHSKHTHSITDVESVLGCKKLHVKRNPHKIHEEFIQSLFDGTSQSNTTPSQSPVREQHGRLGFRVTELPSPLNQNFT